MTNVLIVQDKTQETCKEMNGVLRNSGPRQNSLSALYHLS